MHSLAAALKDYGPAIGPALAFMLGIVALVLKYKIDQLMARWTLSRRIANLQSIVTASAPPADFHPKGSVGGLITADEARNLTNLARFYSNLLTLQPAFEAVGNAISEHGNTTQTRRFYAAKWWFDLLIKKVEVWRTEELFRLSSDEHAELLRDWQVFEDSLLGRTTMDYIPHAKDRNSGP